MQLRDYQVEAVRSIKNEVVDGSNKQVIVLATGLGKAQPVSSKVLTPTGFRPMGDIYVGDMVIGKNGLPTKVTGVFPQGVQPTYRITFSDSTSTRSTAEHLWPVSTKVQVSRNIPGVAKELRDFMDNLTDGNGAYKWFVPLCEPVNMKEQPLPLDPYLLGVLLGNGALRHGVKVSLPDAFILQKVSELLPDDATLVQLSSIDYSISRKKGTAQANSITAVLRELGLFGKGSLEKFIPEIYRHNSLTNRLRLLQGLMDTDGYANPDGGAEFYTSSPILAEHVADIIRSFGGRTGVRTKLNNAYTHNGERRQGATSYRVNASSLPVNPFQLPRKAEGYRVQQDSRLKPTKAIIKVVADVPEECQCISVENSDHLYITDEYIVTHNTVVFSSLINDRIKQEGGKALVLAHREELLTQAQEKIKAFNPLLRVNIEMGSQEAHEDDSDVIIASVPTLGRAGSSRILKYNPLQFRTIVVDECHHSSSDSYINIFKHFGVYKGDEGEYDFNKECLLLGVTATPSRSDNKGIDQIFDTTTFEYGIIDGIKNGYLSTIKAYRINTGTDLTHVKKTAGDFNLGELGDAVNNEERNGLIIKSYKEHVPGKQTLVFAVDVAHTESLAAQFNKYGIPATWVTGALDRSERRQRLQDFSDGRYKVMVNAMVLCLDLETEILTDQGWTKYNEMTYQHKVANWNIEDGSIYFKEPDEIVVRDLYDFESMVSIEAPHANIRVTNTHRLVFKHPEDISWSKKAAGDLVGKKFTYPTSGAAEPIVFGEDRRKKYLNVSKPRFVSYTKSSLKNRLGLEEEQAKLEAEKIYDNKSNLATKLPHELTLDECRLIGFWIGDGSANHLEKGGTEYTLCQSQVYPAIIAWVDELLASLHLDVIKRSKPGNGYSDYYVWSLPRGTGGYNQSRIGLYSLEPYLVKAGTELLWGLTRNQLLSLLEGFHKADGNHSATNTNFVISNTNYSLLSMLQAICACRNISSTISSTVPKRVNHKVVYNFSYRTDKSQKRMSSLDIDKRLAFEKYKPEQVWCVKTQTKNIITRRKGRVIIMGNTEGYDNPSIQAVMMARPTQSGILYQQMVGRGTRLYPGKNALTLIDFVDNTRRQSLKTSSSLVGLDGDIDFKGNDIVKKKDQLDELLELAPNVDLSTIDVNRIEYAIEEVDVLSGLTLPEELTELTKNDWHRYSESEYRIGLGDGGMMHVRQTLTGQYQVEHSQFYKEDLTTTEYEVGTYASLEVAMFKADQFIVKYKPDSMKLIQTSASWRSQEMTAPQRQLLQKKFGINEVVLNQLTKGQASRLIQKMLNYSEQKRLK